MTLATGTGITVNVACPDRLPARAVMVVCPIVIAVIDPIAEIVATVGALDDHATEPVAIGAPV